MGSSTLEKPLKEGGVVARDACLYFAHQRQNGNKSITLKKAVQETLSHCTCEDSEDLIYEIAVGALIYRRREAKKQKQLQYHFSDSAKILSPEEYEALRKRHEASLPYNND